MSAIGRIFIVLNLILAAGFLGWATSAMGTVEDYKTQKADLQAEFDAKVQELEGQISDLRSENQSLSDSSRDFRAERDAAQSDADDLRTQLAAAQRNLEEKDAAISGIEAKLEDYNSANAAITQQKDAAVQRANEAERERDDALEAQQAAELAKRDADDSVTAANRQIASLEGEISNLQGQVQGLNNKLDTIAALYDVDMNNVAAVPEINGAVLSASFDTKPGLVMLNVGKNNGVRRGYTFHIYRGSQYKGEARVESVQDEFCSAVITGVNGDSTMSQGDRASTIL